MAERRVRIGYGRTVQNAPYESIRLDVAIEKDVGSEDNLQQVVDKTVDSLSLYIKKKIAYIIENE